MVASQPFAAGHLLRPLLDMSRAELAEAAQSLPYGWVEDESNEDPSYDRNFLRQQIIPCSGPLARHGPDDGAHHGPVRRAGGAHQRAGRGGLAGGG